MRREIARLQLSIGDALAAISRREWREAWASPLYANSVYLMARAVVGAALGLVFWIVVARLYPIGHLGLGSALISAATLLAFVASLGLGFGLIRFLPGAGRDAGALINSALAISGIIAVVIAIIFLAGVSLWSPALSFVRENPIFALAFIAFIAAATLAALVDEAFVGLRRAKFALAQDSLQCLLKVAVVAAMAGPFRIFGIFASWGLAGAIALALSLFLFLPRLLPGYRPVPSLRRQVSNEMVHFSFANYVSNGLWMAPSWILPILVVNLLGGEANAYFFVAWGMAGLLFAIPTATSMSLFAEGSYDEKFLGRDVRRSLGLIALLLAPAIVVMLVAGDKLLLLFGREYSSEGTRVLSVLAFSALPMAINLVYLGIARVRKRLRSIIVVAATVAFTTLILSYLLVPRLGILAPAVGWLVSHGVVALVVVPTIWKDLRSEPTVAPALSAEHRPE